MMDFFGCLSSTKNLVSREQICGGYEFPSFLNPALLAQVIGYMLCNKKNEKDEKAMCFEKNEKKITAT